MIRKETCQNCKGNRYIAVKAGNGKTSHIRCPHCSGHGYRIRQSR